MQTQYQSIVQLAQAVDAARVAQKDFIADTRHMGLVTGEPGDNIQLAVQDAGNFAVNDYAHRQIAERVGIPAKYYDKMKGEAPELLAANVNTWFERNPERRMVRTQSGVTRAFLSDRYQRVDNHHVLGVVLPVLQEVASDLQFHSLALTDTRMYVKAILPTVRAEINVGEIVEAGVEFRNGEIGNSRFEVWPFAYKLTCKNGARFETGGFKKMHVGARAEVGDDVYEMLADETLKADDHAFLLKVRDIVQATLTQRSFDKLADKMRDATKEKLGGNPAKAVELLGDSLGFNDDERGSVLRHLIEGGDLSRWGLANAITRTAQDLESYDRSDELEGFGGRVIELPRNEWAELAKAA